MRLPSLDISLRSQGGATAALLTVANVTGTTVTTNAANDYRVTKSGGVDGAWDASATGSQAMAGDFLIRFRPVNSTLSCSGGVNTDPNTDNSYTSIDHCFLFQGSAAYLFEGGANSGTISAVVANGDNFFIRRVGTSLTIESGGSAAGVGTSVFATRTNGSTLYVDTSLNAATSAVDIARLS